VSLLVHCSATTCVFLVATRHADNRRCPPLSSPVPSPHSHCPTSDITHTHHSHPLLSAPLLGATLNTQQPHHTQLLKLPSSPSLASSGNKISRAHLARVEWFNKHAAMCYRVSGSSPHDISWSRVCVLRAYAVDFQHSIRFPPFHVF
jgi:hypothetical protein